jgi:hypothetical protein
MCKHRRDCISLCREAGLTVIRVENRGRHLGIRCAEGLIILPSTPSDRRWRYNAIAVARRIAQQH